MHPVYPNEMYICIGPILKDNCIEQIILEEKYHTLVLTLQM